jgi:hypothetical protein
MKPIGSTQPLPPAVEFGATEAASPGPEVEQSIAAPIAVANSSEVVTAANPDLLELNDVRERFFQRVVPRTSRSAQLLLKAADVRALDGQRLTIALASEEMRQNTEMIAQGLRGAMDHEFKTVLHVEWVVDPSLVGVASAPSQRSSPRRAPENIVDDDYAVEESSIIVTSAADHLITEMFPGSEEIS